MKKVEKKKVEIEKEVIVFYCDECNSEISNMVTANDIFFKGPVGTITAEIEGIRKSIHFCNKECAAKYFSKAKK